MFYINHAIVYIIYATFKFVVESISSEVGKFVLFYLNNTVTR